MKTINIIKTSFLFGLVLTMGACGEKNGIEKTAEQERAALEKMKLDSLERVYMVTLDEIDAGLDEVRNKYGVLMLKPNRNTDNGISVRDQIIENITVINGILAKNKEKVKQLEASLKKYKRGKEEMIRSIELATKRVEEQEKTIELLKYELEQKNYTIAELNKLTDALDNSLANLKEENKKLTEKTQTKYFTYGTKKELKNKKILKKEKGIFNLNKETKIAAEGNENEFAKLNMYDNTQLTMLGKQPKLITPHPEGSYTWLKEENQVAVLVINDPENFWKASNYLIVETK